MTVGSDQKPEPRIMPAAGGAHGSSGAILGGPRSDSLPPVLRHRWWLYLAIVNAILFVTTFYVGSAFPYEFFLRPLALSTEQGIGTWWSGLQFLLFALLAQSHALTPDPRVRSISRGLTLIALVGLVLVLDEMGSVHERVNHFIPLPGDLALVPLAIGGGALLACGLFPLIQRRDIVGKAPWMIVTAFFLFALVYVLEFVEHRLTWDVAAWRGLRYAIEEGLELVGGMVLLGSMVHIRRALDASAGLDPTILMPTVPALLWLHRLMLYAALPFWLLRTTLTAEQLSLPLRGDFGILIPIAVLIVAALLAIHHGFSDTRSRLAWWSLACLLLLASLDLECHFHHYLFHGDVDIRWRGDLGLIWSTPLLLLGTLAIPALRSRTNLALLGAGYALVIASVALGAVPLALATPYVVAFSMVHVVRSIAAPELDPPASGADRPITAG